LGGSVTNTFLDCIKIAEDTLNANEYDTPEAKFNQDFNEFMTGLEHPNSVDPDHIEIKPELLDPVDDQEFIDYIGLKKRIH